MIGPRPKQSSKGFNSKDNFTHNILFKLKKPSQQDPRSKFSMTSVTQIAGHPLPSHGDDNLSSESRVKIPYNNNIAPNSKRDSGSLSPKFSKEQPHSLSTFGIEAAKKESSKKVQFQFISPLFNQELKKQSTKEIHVTT